MIVWPVGRGIGFPAAMGRFPLQHLEDAASSRGRPSHGWDCVCTARSHAPHGNAFLAAPAARATVRLQGVGTCSHAGAWEPGTAKRGQIEETAA